MTKALSLIAGLAALLASYYLFGPAAPPEKASPPSIAERSAMLDATTAPSRAAKGTIDLNSASLQDLTALPGIGPVTANKILRLRAQLGRFDRPEQLILIPGMSERKFNRLQSYLKPLK